MVINVSTVDSISVMNILAYEKGIPKRLDSCDELTETLALFQNCYSINIGMLKKYFTFKLKKSYSKKRKGQKINSKRFLPNERNKCISIQK